jgi:type IV pilus assembly protein PilE
MNNAKGFTLIEVMVVVAIVAILAAVALPSYSEHTRRAKITEATSQLADLRVRMEQYFMDNRTYQGTGTACGVTMPTATVRYFALTCSAPTSSTYTVTATGTGDMSGFTYTINDQNVRATTAVPTGWTAKNNCWVIKKGGMC